MSKVLRYTAYLAGFAQILIAVYLLILEAYSIEDVFVASLLIIAPLLLIVALWGGPDLEIRRLNRSVVKARLEKELKELSGKAEKSNVKKK